ncbi:MAG TPA: IS91 family transposase [Vicinamibacterales bacterium]|nr:IS91 family transposase [Vicinamibacterales bacterium]
MPTVADIIRRHGAAYRAHVGDRLLPSQARVLRDLAGCRTAYFGGALTRCDHCDAQVHRYHSCGNRHCPTCHGPRTEQWLETQRAQLLPCPYYLVTFTLPRDLRALAFAHQRVVYGVLMRSAAAALQRLAADPRYVGARLGCLAVLHTWTRAMLYHPHVHLLVTAGGLSADGMQWIAPRHPAFLVPVRALSVIFRAKVCAALRRAGLLDQVSPSTWTAPWVVHAQPAGRGQRVLEYLGRYVFRIAIANSRVEEVGDDDVTFRYQDNRTHETRRVTLTGVAFLERFLQHVLPRGCAKVRYYGLWSAAHRADRARARALLAAPTVIAASEALAPARASSLDDLPRCPHCRVGRLILIAVLRPWWSRPP